MRTGYINIVLPGGAERKVKSIERGAGDMSDAHRKDQALRIEEIKFQKEISQGSRLRLYNAQGRLEIESE